MKVRCIQYSLTRNKLTSLFIALSLISHYSLANANAVDFSDSQPPIIKEVTVDSPRQVTRGVPGQYSVSVTMLDDKNESFMKNGGFYFPSGDYLNFVCFNGRISTTVSRDASGVTTTQKFVCEWTPFNLKAGVGRIGNFEFEDKAGNKGKSNVVADSTNSLSILEPAVTPPQNAPTDVKINWNGSAHFLSWSQTDNPSWLPTLRFQVEWSNDGKNWKSATGSMEKRFQIDLPIGSTIFARVASNNYFGLSTFAETGPFKAPEAGLFPRFGIVTRNSKGFSFQISNYDSQYTWIASSTTGTATVSSSGLVSVTGIDFGKSALVTIRTQRDGFENAASNISGSALNEGLIPRFGNASSTTDSVSIPVINYDPSFIWTVKSSSGSASISFNGQISVRGLAAGAAVNVDVGSSREGYETQSSSVTVNTLTPFTSPTPQSNGQSSKLRTITCVKGKQTKKVTGLNPKCPKGFRLR